MTKDSKHMKRYAAPRSWSIGRKEHVWAVRPLPGPHKKEQSIPLMVALRDLLHLGQTSAEVKKILGRREVLVDGNARVDHKHIVGLMDIISIPKVDRHYRVMLDPRGKIALRSIEATQSKWKLVDGDRERAIQHFAVYDAYDTNYGCFQALFSERVIKGGKLADRRLEVMRGSTKYELSIEEIEQLHFTGKKVENKPEIVISKRNGLKIACTLLLRSRLMCTPPRGKSMVFSIKEAEVSETHGIENDDMILFARPFGWEGVSLLPIRSIKIARLRADDVITADAKEQPKEKLPNPSPTLEEERSKFSRTERIPRIILH